MFTILLAAIGYGVYFYLYKHFYVRILSAGPNHEEVVQIIKNATEWGLQEAEGIVAQLPYIIECSKLNYRQTRKVVSDLQKAGATAQFVVRHFWQKKIQDGPMA